MSLDEAVTEANLRNEAERLKGSPIRYFTVADPPCVNPTEHKVVSRVLSQEARRQQRQHKASRLARLFH